MKPGVHSSHNYLNIQAYDVYHGPRSGVCLTACDAQAGRNKMHFVTFSEIINL